jgi:NAD(P)H dehydrogenase (quinone)
MTIVVTGASGGLGMRVAQRLTAYAEGNAAVSAGADPQTNPAVLGSADSHANTAFVAAGNAGVAGGAEPRVRLLFRDPRKVPDGVDAVVADYGDGESARRALDGVDTVFMVSAAETPERVEHHRTFIDAAAAAGVRHLVYTSFLAAGPESTFTLGRDHWHTEEHIRRSGLAFTLLRDNLYSDFLPNMVGADGVIRGPAANGRASVVARDDVADVAAAVLRDPAAHEAKTYELTGPAALTLTEAAAIISRGDRARGALSGRDDPRGVRVPPDL